MVTQQVFDLLEKVHEKMPDYEEKTIRLFSLLYRDIYQEKIEGFLDELEQLDDGNWQDLDFFKEFEDEISLFIDEDESILTYYTEMINDGNKEFIDAFFNKISTYFIMVDNNLYREEDFTPITLIFNIYAMLKSYHFYKDDLELYKELINDFSKLIEKNSIAVTGIYTSKYPFLEKKKEILSKLFCLRNFKDYPVLRKSIVSFLNQLSVSYTDSDELDTYSEYLDLIEEIIQDAEEIKESDPDFDLNNSRVIIEDILTRCTKEEYEYFYAPILLYGNRFEYIKECYDKYVDNSDIMDEIIGDISDLDNNIFTLLDENTEGGKDSFITCMNIVFDSDTFYEVKSKLEVLKKASTLYTDTEAEIKDILMKLNELHSDEHKKVVLDKKIMYNTTSMNITEKPDLIYERTGELYEDIFGISLGDYDYPLEDMYESSESIDEFENNIDSYFNDAYEEMQENKQTEEISKVEIDGLGSTLYVDKKDFSTEDVQPGPQSQTGFQKIKSIFGKK